MEDKIVAARVTLRRNFRGRGADGTAFLIYLKYLQYHGRDSVNPAYTNDTAVFSVSVAAILRHPGYVPHPLLIPFDRVLVNPSKWCCRQHKAVFETRVVLFLNKVRGNDAEPFVPHENLLMSPRLLIAEPLLFPSWWEEQTNQTVLVAEETAALPFPVEILDIIAMYMID